MPCQRRLLCRRIRGARRSYQRHNHPRCRDTGCAENKLTPLFPTFPRRSIRADVTQLGCPGGVASSCCPRPFPVTPSWVSHPGQGAEPSGAPPGSGGTSTGNTYPQGATPCRDPQTASKWATAGRGINPALIQYRTQPNELRFLSHKATLPFLSRSVLFSMWPLYIGPFYYSNLKWREKTLQFAPILFCFFFLLSREGGKKNPKASSAIQLVRFCTWALQWFTLTAVIFFIGGNWKFRDTEWPLHAGGNKSLYFQLPLRTAKLLSHPPYSLLKIVACL